MSFTNGWTYHNRVETINWVACISNILWSINVHNSIIIFQNICLQSKTWLQVPIELWNWNWNTCHFLSVLPILVAAFNTQYHTNEWNKEYNLVSKIIDSQTSDHIKRFVRTASTLNQYLLVGSLWTIDIASLIKTMFVIIWHLASQKMRLNDTGYWRF